METLNVSMAKGKVMASKIGLSCLTLLFGVLFYLAWTNNWSLAHIIFLFDNFFILLALGLCTGIMCFGLYWMMFRLDGSKPSLVLEDDGYTDNVGILKGHKYLYKDIERFDDKTVNMNRCILVYFKDVDAFLDSQTGFKKKMMSASYKQMGTPISIPARGFEIKFEDLLAELNKRLEASR